MEPYTKITFETYYPRQKDLHKFTIKVNKWDLSLEEAYELVDQLLSGAGYKIDKTDV